MALATLPIMAFSITADCVGCGACKNKCPWNAIMGEKKKIHLIEPTLCRGCGTCWYSCPRRAVVDVNGFRREAGKPRIPKASIDRSACVGCQNCLLNCEQHAIVFRSKRWSGVCEVESDLCSGCGRCLTGCAGDCISLV